MKSVFCLILSQHGVFSFTKVCIFLPMVFIMTFITTLCFYDFCKTVLVKKCTPCQGVVWVSPSKCHIFYTGFLVVLYLHNWSPLKPQNKLQKKTRALPLSSRRGLCAPDHANPSSEKMTSQPTWFCCAYFSKSVMNLHWLFNMSCIIHILTYFSKNEVRMDVIYFLICVRKHKSNLPTNICATGGNKTQW